MRGMSGLEVLFLVARSSNPVALLKAEGSCGVSEANTVSLDGAR